MNPFDAVFLDQYVFTLFYVLLILLTFVVTSDRRTGELLRGLNTTDSLTFYDYGTSPPRQVLDVGCGQGLVTLSLLDCDLLNRRQTLGR